MVEPANSSSGEEEDLSSEASESESDPDNSSPPPPPPENPQLPDPTPSNPTIDDQSKKPRSKNPISRYSPPPIKQPTGKRPVPEPEDTDPKRIKSLTTTMVTSPDANNGGEKKQLFQRLWSEENEIELIQGMISYVEQKGKDPVADVNDFHEFVKQSLHVDVNDRQMLAKARRLKKKYVNNVARVENKAKVRAFSNPHEKKMYDLSKNLWGDETNKKVVMSSCSKKVNVKVNVTPKSNKSCKPVGLDDGNAVEVKVVQPVRSVGGSDHLGDHLGSLGLEVTDEAIMNKGLELVMGEKKVEMEEKWKSLKVLELEHFMKKMDVLKEQAGIVLNAIAKSVAK